MAHQSKEGVKQTHSLRDFKGVNTQASRQNIGDDEFAWLENVVPVGFGNLQALPGASGVLANWGPDVAYHVDTANLNNVDYYFVFTTNGAAYRIDLTTYAKVEFASAGTFSGTGTAMSQWSNTDIVIIDPTSGYFTYDGTTLTLQTGTIQSLTATEIGTGYTSPPTLAIAAPGGGGTTATATADLQVNTATLSNAGTGYTVGDVLTLAGGTLGASGLAAELEVSSIGGSGAISGVNLTQTGDYTTVPSNAVSVTGGSGSGATFNIDWGIGPITLTNPGSGYTSDPAVTITGGSGSGAAITANLSVVPSEGTCIATYAGRVWVANDRTIIFSAPGSFTDFTSANAGGSFIITDSTLHSTIQALLSANDYLYIVGTTSINILSGVQIVSGNTVFSNTNISASIGTEQIYSVVAYYRSIAFATPYGFYILSGTTPQKISDHLDGIFPSITDAIPITAGTVVVNDVICLAFMFQYQQNPNYAPTLIAILFNKKWIFYSDFTYTLMATSLVGGQPSLYATDGMNLYKPLSNVNASLIQTIMTKLWDMGDPVRDKQVLKVGIETITDSFLNSITGRVDTEISTNFADFSITQNPGNTVNWVNNSGQTVTWLNNLNQVVIWFPFSIGYNFVKADVETSGKYVGITLIGSAPQQTYSAFHLQYELRAQWTTMPT